MPPMWGGATPRADLTSAALACVADLVGIPEKVWGFSVRHIKYRILNELRPYVP